MLLRTKAKLVLVAYLLLAPLLAFLSLKFIQSTNSEFDAPTGSLVKDTELIAGELMTTQVFHNPLFFTVANSNGSAVVYEGMDLAAAPLCKLGSFVESLRTHPLVHGTPGIVSVKWYCHFAQFPSFARQLVSSDNKTALIAVDLFTKGGLLGGGETGPHATIEAVHSYVASTLSKEDPTIVVKSTSVDEVFSDLKSGLLGDLLVIDSVSIPLATAALALCLRSIRMIGIPLPSVLLSVTLTFSLLYPVALHTSVSSFAPEFCMGTMIALTIDYSLFILSRFRERIALTRLAGSDLRDDAVQAKIVYDTAVLTAENIVVSGMTVAIALGMLLVVPIATVATIGAAQALGALCTIFVSLTFQPALLLVFFDFFSQDPCFNVLYKYAPFLKKYFADDLLLESGMLDQDVNSRASNNNNDDYCKKHDENVKNNSLPVLHCSPSNLTFPQGSAVATSLTIDDTANYKTDSYLTEKSDEGTSPATTNNENNMNKKKSQAQQQQQQNNYNTNSNSKKQKPKSAVTAAAPPTMNTLFEREDLIQYRGSQMRLSNTSPSPSQAHLFSTNNYDNNNNGENDRLLRIQNSSRRQHEEIDDEQTGAGEEGNFINDATQLEAAEGAARRAQYRSFWFKLGRWVIAHPYVTLLAVSILGAPLCWMSSRTKLTFDMFLQVPEGSAHVATLFEVADHIGSGTLSTPFYITVDTGRPNGVGEILRNITYFNETANKTEVIANISLFAFNPDFWKEMQRLVSFLERSIPQPSQMLTSIVSLPGAPTAAATTTTTNFSFSSVEADALMNCARAANTNDFPQKIDKDLNLCLEYQLLYNHTVDETRRMALIILAPLVNPFGTRAYDYCSDIYRAIQDFTLNNTYNSNEEGGQQSPQPVIAKLGFFGASAASWAILRKMNELLPLQLGLMFLVIFVVCFAVFRSVFVPLRMILTVAFPVATALGVGALFFQVAPLNRIWSVDVAGYSWLVPEFSFTLLCALALDYDIFLLTRVVEYKKLGFTNEAALSKGVYKSSRTISFAGIIMCFSFGGMMFSNVMMMVQFGFVATIAVLIDTFVMRPIVVPALMTVVPERVVWWPRNFGPNANTRGVDDMTESRGVGDERDFPSSAQIHRHDNDNDAENENDDQVRDGNKMSSDLRGRRSQTAAQKQEQEEKYRPAVVLHQPPNANRFGAGRAGSQLDNEFDYGATSY